MNKKAFFSIVSLTVLLPIITATVNAFEAQPSKKEADKSLAVTAEESNFHARAKGDAIEQTRKAPEASGLIRVVHNPREGKCKRQVGFVATRLPKMAAESNERAIIMQKAMTSIFCARAQREANEHEQSIVRSSPGASNVVRVVHYPGQSPRQIGFTATG